MDSLRRRTPGISKELPAVRDLWGQPIEFRSGLGWATRIHLGWDP